MARILRFQTVAVLTLALAAMGMGLMGVAAADDTENETADYVRAIDSETVITDWEYTDDRFVIEIDAESSTTITMAESADWEEGDGEYTYIAEDVDAGNTTLTVPTIASSGEGVALSFATPLSADEGRAPYISTGTQAEQNPLEHFGGESGLLFGIVMTVVIAAASAAYVVYTESTGVRKAS